MSRWDGIGLAIHVGECAIGNYACVDRIVYALWSTVGCVAALIAYHWRGRIPDDFPLSARSGSWIALLIVASTIVAVGYDALSGKGILSAAAARKYVDATHRAQFRPASYGELMRVLDNPQNSIVVDARYAADFQQGHIPSAINLPVSISDHDLMNAVGHFDRNSAVIVYCQSDQCGFDEIIGTRLVALSFNHIRVWQEGWNGWRQICAQQEMGDWN
jgi:rhodanese-related sulfurtransferase